MNSKLSYQEYLQTDAWKGVSYIVKSKAGFRCQICNSPDDLQAHHRTYEHLGNEIKHLGDLVCLCRRCHTVFHEFVQHPTEVRVPPTPPAPAGSIILTKKMIEALKTERGGYTSCTLRAIGIQFPPSRGWAKKLIGARIENSNYMKALSGRGTKKQ